MHVRIFGAGAIGVVAAVVGLVVVDARPNRYGHGDREERHMFPAVSSGPLDPAWSPDGRWIAFSMRGDIWKIPADGGEAIAITAGPAYHFEPAWSPDGTRIAFSHQSIGNLEIGIVSADGGAEQVVASHPRVDIEPAWSRDGASLYFTSARNGGFRIFRYDVATSAVTEVVAGIQPAISPDGKQLAYEQRAIRILDLATGQSRLVRDEETEYRTEPVWTPDGQNLLYVTEDKNSNDIRTIPAAGGDPIELTIDTEHHEMSPTVSPDGRRFAFVQFEAGVPTLYTAGIAGGRASAWRKVPITARRPVQPTGRVRLRVLGADGRAVAARIYVDASDGRHYTPDGLFHRSMMVFDRHYFHASGDVELELPAGRATIEAVRGWQYQPRTMTVDVKAGAVQPATIQLERLIDLPAQGWYSGDSHVHDLHQGFGLTHEAFFRQLVAEDLNVTHALIHMDGTRLMGRWADLTGTPNPLSTPTHILQDAQEFRGGLGHVGMIGLREFILPFTAGAGNVVRTALARAHLSRRRARAGRARRVHVSVHVGAGHAGECCGHADRARRRPRPGRLLRCRRALFRRARLCRFLQSPAQCRLPHSGDRGHGQLLRRLARSAAGIGSHVRESHWRAHDAELDGGNQRGRTFFSTGPIVLLQVDGREPGDEIRVAASAPPTVPVKADVRSIAPVDTLEILVNGDVVQTVRATDPARVTFEGAIAIPLGGWIAARVVGPKSKYLGDDYAFAQTTPVFVVRGDRRYLKGADVKFLADTVDAIWGRVERARWRSDAEREAFRAAVDRARAVYQNLLAEAGSK